MNELVSIITPAFNAAKYIEATIQSVLDQTYPYWEMIIIDDCSNDNTVAIVESYAKVDGRIRLIKNRNNLHVAQTRNNGISVARGKYIAFLDADDLWAPEKLEKQVAFMELNNIVLSFSMYQMILSSTNRYGKVIKIPQKITSTALLGNTAIGCLTVMVNRDLSGDFAMPLLSHCEDTCTWYSILKKGFAAYGIQEVLAYYRVSDNSLTKNKKKAAKEQWNVYRKYFEFSFFKSLYYFTKYAFNAVRKRF